MSQNKEATQFLSRVLDLPKGNVSLDGVLQPSLDDEAELRKLFATDKGNPRLKDIHVGLVDIFAAPNDIRVTRARVVTNDADRDAQHVMPLSDALRREEGSPAMVESLESFKKNWSIFTENSLSQLSDWSNVVAAGGSVQACLIPLPKAATASKRAMRKYYHEKAFPSSDVDLFLYGLTTQEAERKIVTIYEAVRDSVPWDVTCVRTKHTISIHSQYPYRSVQIVLRLYSSPAEILAGFDVDAPCCAYDGDRVWANPRAIVSMMRQSNTVDMTRRSPSYEVRLAKYSSRGFEVYIPGLKRSEIDPTIYERAVGRVQGLARLLAIEKLATPELRSQYQQRRSILRGRNSHTTCVRTGRTYKGDLKADAAFSGLESSDYDVINLHIPYGPGWDTKKIEKLIYKTDFGANSPYNPKNKDRRLHRHSAFFGTMRECIEDCCEYCPEPGNAEEHGLQDEEDKLYVRGRVSFIKEDPGRQSISGSFNPIDEGEWSETAYIQATAKFFGAISKNDTVTVTQLIQDGEDVNRRDYVGRTPLHVAIMSNSVECANTLIDADARMTARLVGGRTSLHLAAHMGQTSLVKKMLARSAYNEEKSAQEILNDKDAAGNPKEAERVRMSSEDDWSSEESDDGKPPSKPPVKGDTEKGSDPLEDDKETPDILDVSLPDWDFGITPLGYAILLGSLEVIDVLLAAGADPNYATRAKDTDPLHPLTLTIYTQDEDRAAKIAERLVAAQAISSTADKYLLTIFHRIVLAKKTKIVMSLLNRDPNAKKVLDFPAWAGHRLIFPLVSSIVSGDYAMLSVLLAYGAKLVYSPEDASRAERANRTRGRVHLPVEVAIAQHDEVVSLLAALGATVDMSINPSYLPDMTLLQWTSGILAKLQTPTVSGPTQEPLIGDTWAQYNAYLTAVLPTKEAEGPVTAMRPRRLPSTVVPQLDEAHALATRDYYTHAESILLNYSAITPQVPQSGATPSVQTSRPQNLTLQGSGYVRHTKVSVVSIPAHLKVLYDELYEACWTGDNATIQELCLPKHLAEGKEPIQISVLTTPDPNSYADLTGWSPFLVALHRRHWETARLVIAIATAQYQASDTEVAPFDPTSDVSLDDDGFYDSDEEEEDYDQQKGIDFVDLAARPSAVRAEVSAKKMLESKSGLLRADDKRVIRNPLQKIIEEGDFEGFVRTLELYQFAGVAIWPDGAAYELVVALDRPDMLDELTRRTGVGIPYPSDAAKKSPANLDKPAKERVYLGLKVGGKPRASTQQIHTENRTLTYNYDLLRNAIASGATKIVEYLAGPRILAAYTCYAATHSDEIAQYLKNVGNLEKTLPDLLGWKIDDLNESPLLCAVIHNELDILKQLFVLKPNLMEEALYNRTKFVGFNALLAAAYFCSSTEIVDFLLEKGCDPSERDTRGWNIYHLACLSHHPKRDEFVAHLLKTLPVDLTHELIAQTSKEASNTPLMLAVKLRYATTVRAMLDFGVAPAVILRKDADGSTPLHIAVQNSNTAIVEVLLHGGPTEQLYIENSVGQTPLDIASLKSLPRVPGSAVANVPREPQVNMDSHLRLLKNAPPFEVEKQKVEIPKLRATLDALLADGRLVRGTKLADELFSFAAHMEGKLAIEIARKSAESVEGKDVVGGYRANLVIPPGDLAHTYALLRDAAAARPRRRQLVHLAEVQQCVKRCLAKQAFVGWRRRIQGIDEEPKVADPEEHRIAQLKARSLFGIAYVRPPIFPYQNQAYLFGEDRF